MAKDGLTQANSELSMTPSQISTCRSAGMPRPTTSGSDLVTDTTAQFKTQLPRNLSLQVLSFILHVGIGIWLVPYLIHHLGRAAYGLIPIAAMMTQYVSLISQNISASVQRFLTIALQRGDVEDANRIFNTAFFSYLALGLVQVPIFALIVYYASEIFSIPQQLFEDAIVLLVCSAASFLINLVCSVFAVPIYANNRLDIARGLDISRMIARLAGIVTLFVVFGPALRYVGYVDLALSIVLCGIQVSVGRRLAPILKLALRCYDWHEVKQLMGMGCWLFVNQVGVLLFLRTDIWVCNRFIGAESAGDYAAVLQWSVLIREAGALVGAVITPMIVICYARSEIERMIRMTSLGVRVLSLALAIPISVMCVFSSSFLSVWLGDPYARLAPLMVIMLCHLVINVGTSPLYNINNAMNKVKWPGLVTLVGGIASLLLALLFGKYLGWGVYGVAVGSAIPLTLRNALFVPIYGARLSGQPWYTFLRCCLSGSMCLVVLIVFGQVICHCIHPTSWVHLVLVSMIMGATGLCLAWFWLPKQDRHLIVGLLPARLGVSIVRLAKMRTQAHGAEYEG
jgi:O-antigen/teichoic acid export membrane protein